VQRTGAVLSMLACILNLGGQLQAGAQASPGGPAKTTAAAETPSTAPTAVKDLPVRKVVLYKNGVGYFEHAGTVNGNQRVTIDFTSSQLNDVLQSLTALDEGGGRIAGVNYNSTTPLDEQLKSLSLGMTDNPTSTELFMALRGQRVEVTGGTGGTLTGRLMSIESRNEKSGSADGATIEKYYLTMVAASGAVKIIELTPALSIRPLDANLQGQLDRYLELLSSTHSTGLRHLTLDSLGQGARELKVSYISEVPVWKSTYRIVFPREANGKATMQGWAVVDNTVGADWDNVQLSLVAGAPQSFIQPLSQPLYTRRPEIPIATEEQTTPQTHEAADMPMPAPLQVAAPKTAMNAQAMRGRSVNGFVAGSVNQTVEVSAANLAMDTSTATLQGQGNGIGYGSGSGGVYRASDAIAEGDVSTNAFDDFFEYALQKPVTIHKNESAMVPILQQELSAEHVTLWNPNGGAPLRTVWLENTSNLTLDSGSFSIFESGEFAGEGLLDPIHPGERRLLSYAADQAMRVRITARDARRTLHHLSIHKGTIVETYNDVSSVTYTAVNSADADRVVLLEHPRQTNGWSLDDNLKPVETAANLYRFRLPVKAHSTEKLEVREHGPQYTTVDLGGNPRQEEFLLQLTKDVPDATTQIQPVIDAEETLAAIEAKIADAKKAEAAAAADEARDRENLTALKGNDAAKRFVDELNRAEDQLQATRKQTADLEAQKQSAEDKLNAVIAALSFEWSVTEK
jgi:hypothetical protein